jgi:lipoprotein-anchoring transpeptidase ErfK/SrfK
MTLKPGSNRREFISKVASGLGLAVSGCVSAKPTPTTVAPAGPAFATLLGSGIASSDTYGPVLGEPFALPAVKLSEINPAYLRKNVDYLSSEMPGTIIIDTKQKYLYYVEGDGRAERYGVGVGREGFGWSGIATIKSKQEWPDWYPPKEMIERQPEIKKLVTDLQGGLGMPGGPRNPLGARAMYLWEDNKDTLYRIHGTIEPWTIGKNVSSGCIRMINQDVIELYSRTPIGSKVIVLPA